MEALGQLAGGIAHDFNNVLQAVIGGLSLIQRRSGDAEVVKHLAAMAGDAAQRGAAITGRLLTFARQSALRAEPVRPLPLLEGLHEMLAHTLGVGIAMRIVADQDLPALLADKGQLETVLVNLAVNARDAMANGGTLLLAAASEAVLDSAHPARLAPGRYLRLTVSDTGLGMDAATLARASEPFFTTKPLGQGTGLGLAMARGFAQQSRGGFAIDSVLGHGTTVTLWLPEAASISVTSDPSLPERTAATLPTSARVLVVDDDTMVREVLAGQMEEQGYCVSQASDGLEALAQLDGGAAVDLLISDFAMPGMNGLTLIQEARRRRPELRAILLTGYADPSVRFGAEAPTRNTALLRKPVSGTVLAEHAAALLAHAVASSD
jgi:CheY-like chemotaxis protein